MSPQEKLQRAVTAALRDSHGGKVLLDLDTAQALLQAVQGNTNNILEDAGFIPADPSGSHEAVMFRRSGKRLGQTDLFHIRPIALHYGETRMWPRENKWYIEALNTNANAVGMFAIDCINGIKE